jgi:hypothetical protein
MIHKLTASLLLTCFAVTVTADQTIIYPDQQHGKTGLQPMVVHYKPAYNVGYPNDVIDFHDGWVELTSPQAEEFIYTRESDDFPDVTFGHTRNLYLEQYQEGRAHLTPNDLVLIKWE